MSDDPDDEGEPYPGDEDDREPTFVEAVCNLAEHFGLAPLEMLDLIERPADFARALVRVRTENRRRLWESMRGLLIAERELRLSRRRPDLTYEEAVAAGHVTAEEAAWAASPTQEEIESSFGPFADY